MNGSQACVTTEMMRRNHINERVTRNAQTDIDAALSRRERELMYALYRFGRSSGQQIQQRLPDSPNYSTVRTILRILERKGLIRHDVERLRYVYEPVIPLCVARKCALEKVVQTFFESSRQQAVIALLNSEAWRLTRPELDELDELIRIQKTKTN